MDYFCFVQSMAAFIETRINEEKILPAELEDAMGMSFPHIREVFRKLNGTPLARYILSRKISNAAYMLKHSEKRIVDIAMEMGFISHDSFSRAFRRMTGKTPRSFRTSPVSVGRVKLAAGIYAPGLSAEEILQPEWNNLEVRMADKKIERKDDSCVLYGVKKVEYSFEESTPYPAVLRSCLNYLGQEIRYSDLMAATGASFRLRWNKRYWDCGNVDISYIYEDHKLSYHKGLEASGRKYQMLWRDSNTTKEEFIDFIKVEIDSGRPVIAFGIIGPPEACLITGYRDKGETLLGWNFFQHMPEFSGGTEIDDTGYFISRRWWENPETVGLIAVAEQEDTMPPVKNILENALWVLTKTEVGPCAGGSAAYEAWAEALSSDDEIAPGLPLPKLFERLMCQNDAVTMIAEGRYYASDYLKSIAQGFSEKSPKVEECIMKAAGYFMEEHRTGMRIPPIYQGFENGEEQARKLAEPEVRDKIVKEIRIAAELDRKATDCLKKALEILL